MSSVIFVVWGFVCLFINLDSQVVVKRLKVLILLFSASQDGPNDVELLRFCRIRTYPDHPSGLYPVILRNFAVPDMKPSPEFDFWHHEAPFQAPEGNLANPQHHQSKQCQAPNLTESNQEWPLVLLQFVIDKSQAFSEGHSLPKHCRCGRGVSCVTLVS